jgi:L-fuconolactonase
VTATTAATEQIIDPDLPICDAHHHLMDLPHLSYMLPDLLADVALGHNVVSTVFVESTAFYRAEGPAPMRFVGETEFAAGVAAMTESDRYGPIRVCAGIVSRADLSQGAACAEVLQAHIAAGGGRLRGIRHCGGWDPSPEIPNSHTDPPQGLYGRPDFREGFAELARHGLSFEAWQYHPQLPEVTALARAFPDTPIMLDHVGGLRGLGPYAGRREEEFQRWKADIRELAQCPNVWVKLSGLGMAAGGFGFEHQPTPPTSDQLAAAWTPYLETSLEAFGVGRAMFASNFPIDRQSCTYDVLWNALKLFASGASAGEKAALFHDNAATFYRLERQSPGS